MEIGYLWLAVSLFLFLMTMGAAIVMAAVAFPLVAQTDTEHFNEAFYSFRRRRVFSLGVLALLSLIFTGLLCFDPPYSFSEDLVVWLTAVFGAIGITTLGSWFVGRKLKRAGFDQRLIDRLATLLWVSALAWSVGSCVLVWIFLDVVGLI